jgi:hypothetical protein
MIAPSIGAGLWALGARPRIAIERLERGRDALERLAGGGDAALAAPPLFADAAAPLVAPIGLDRVLAGAVDRAREAAATRDEIGEPVHRSAVASAPAAAARLRSVAAIAPLRSMAPPRSTRSRSVAAATTDDAPAAAHVPPPPPIDRDRAALVVPDRAGDRAAARAWLAARAARAGTAETIDRTVVTAPAVIAVPLPAASAPRRARGPGGIALDASPAGELAAPSPLASPIDPAAAIAGLVDRVGRSSPHSARREPIGAIDRAGAIGAIDRGGAIGAIDHRGASVASPAARAEPLAPAPAALPLASAPLAPLRRFAVLAEATAPPAPGEPPPTRPPPPLDDAELAERLDRILRREARRDGLDLDP